MPSSPDVIFLDFDGVMVTARCDCDDHVFPDFDPVCVANLNDLVARSGAEIVVTSSWRHAHPRVLNLGDFFVDQGLDARIYSMTGRGGSEHRGIRIARWLLDNDHGAYVILDDLDIRPRNRLVRTSWEQGLLLAHVHLALENLDDQNNRRLLDE